MFLNWLVLISWLAATMMIPRLYLAAINLQPDWSGLSTWNSWKNPPANWDGWWKLVERPWDTALTILLAVGIALVAIAMAYAIIDVPSTGNARLSQRRFLTFRQLPVLLASLVLAEWWAVFRNVHGSELFQPKKLLPWFIGFTLASYICGGIIARVILWFREAKGAPRRRLASPLDRSYGGNCRVLPVGDGNPNVFGTPRKLNSPVTTKRSKFPLSRSPRSPPGPTASLGKSLTEVTLFEPIKARHGLRETLRS